MADACHKRGIERAMVDVKESSSNLTPDDLAALTSAFTAIGFSKRLRLAILHGGDQEYRAKLFAFISAMRGWKVRAFEDFERAFDWLSGDDDSEHDSAENAVPIQLKSPASEPPSGIKRLNL